MQVKDCAGAVTVKDESRGLVEAVFSSFNTVDKDGDVTVPGAITHGEQVAISPYGHRIWDGSAPVGRGVVRTNSREASVEAQFFMDTTAGRDTFLAVKHMAELGRWSYGFETLERDQGEFAGQRVQFLRKLRVFEVSPVLRAAGIDTRTTSVKGVCACGCHTATNSPPELVHEMRMIRAQFHAKQWVEMDEIRRAVYAEDTRRLARDFQLEQGRRALLQAAERWGLMR